MSIEWRKSSRSQPQGGECVELSTNLSAITLVRDSTDPEGPRLGLDRHALATLLRTVKAGRHDLV